MTKLNQFIVQNMTMRGYVIKVRVIMETRISWASSDNFCQDGGWDEAGYTLDHGDMGWHDEEAYKYLIFQHFGMKT